MSAFSEEELAGFLLGAWTPCVSSNVAEARWDADTETLTIGFDGGDKGGHAEFYDYPCSFELAKSFAQADSKGRWRWQHFPKGDTRVRKTIRVE